MMMTKSAMIRNARLGLLVLALLWVLFTTFSGPKPSVDAGVAEEKGPTSAHHAKAKGATKAVGSGRSNAANKGGSGARPHTGATHSSGGSSSKSGGGGVTKKAPGAPTLRGSGNGGKPKAPSSNSRSSNNNNPKHDSPSSSSSSSSSHAAKSQHTSNDNDDGDSIDDGSGGDVVNARGAGKARLSNAVCNSTKSPRPSLDGLPLVMPFSRGIMGKRGKLRKDDLFIHRGNYAKNRLQDVIPDPSLLPESAEAIWSGYPFRRCALVGNSGSLTGKELGAAIDEHDVVIRLNQAPTKGYTPDVGKRATFRLLNSLWTGLYATVPTSAATLRADGALDAREGARLGEAKALPMERNATLVVTRAEAESYAKLRDAMGKLRPDVKLLMLAPRIVTAAKWLMREYRIRLCEAGYGPFPGGNTPSSGLVAAYILVQTCDRLNLFGFGGNGDDDVERGGGTGGTGGAGARAGGGGATTSKYHYYSGVGHRNVGTVVHSWGAELELLAGMARDGLITLCMSGDQEECVDPDAPPQPRRITTKRTNDAMGGDNTAVDLSSSSVSTVSSSKSAHNKPRHNPVAAGLARVAARDKAKPIELDEKEEEEDATEAEGKAEADSGETVGAVEGDVGEEELPEDGARGADAGADVAVQEEEEEEEEEEGVEMEAESGTAAEDERGKDTESEAQ